MFFRQIIEAFLVRTEPDSSMVKPAHIHITSTPKMMNKKVLKTNWVSPSTAAYATVGTQSSAPSIRSTLPTRVR